MVVALQGAPESLPTSDSCWQDASIEITESTSCLAVGGGRCLDANQPLEWDSHSWHFSGIAQSVLSVSLVCQQLLVGNVLWHWRAVCTWKWTTDVGLAKCSFERQIKTRVGRQYQLRELLRSHWRCYVEPHTTGELSRNPWRTTEMYQTIPIIHSRATKEPLKKQRCYITTQPHKTNLISSCRFK